MGGEWGDLQRVGELGMLSWEETERLRDWKLRLGVSMGGDPEAASCGDRTTTCQYISSTCTGKSLSFIIE